MAKSIWSCTHVFHVYTRWHFPYGFYVYKTTSNPAAFFRSVTSYGFSTCIPDVIHVDMVMYTCMPRAYQMAFPYGFHVAKTTCIPCAQIHMQSTCTKPKDFHNELCFLGLALFFINCFYTFLMAPLGLELVL